MIEDKKYEWILEGVIDDILHLKEVVSDLKSIRSSAEKELTDFRFRLVLLEKDLNQLENFRERLMDCEQSIDLLLDRR